MSVSNVWHTNPICLVFGWKVECWIYLDILYFIQTYVQFCHNILNPSVVFIWQVAVDHFKNIQCFRLRKTMEIVFSYNESSMWIFPFSVHECVTQSTLPNLLLGWLFWRNKHPRGYSVPATIYSIMIFCVIPKLVWLLIPM